MDTNTIVTGMSMVLGAPEIMSAFNAGLLFSATIVAALFGFTIIRCTTEETEEM